jgi:DNA-binding Lrp family transcriptional regulator
MKIKDIPRLRKQVMTMLPVTQAKMWKALGISSKDGSELIGYLINDKIVKRTTIKIDGKRTFLLESANGNGHAKIIDYSILLINGRFSPCCGCGTECVPVNCMRLIEWLIGE